MEQLPAALGTLRPSNRSGLNAEKQALGPGRALLLPQEPESRRYQGYERYGTVSRSVQASGDSGEVLGSQA